MPQLYQQLVVRYVLPGRMTELMANVGKCTSREYHMQRKVFAGESYKSVLLFEQTSSYLELSSPRSSSCLVVHFSLRQRASTRPRAPEFSSDCAFTFTFTFSYRTPHLPGAVDPKSRMLGVVYNWNLEAELNKIARTDSGSYYSTNSNNAPFRPSLPVIATIT